jgi:hypothetical protein
VGVKCRDDTSFLAGRLYERLLEHFPQDKIFMELDRVAHGEDLVKTIEKAIESSDILIVVIGKQWLVSDLENLHDCVHLELAAAFKRKIPVIPVAVEGASMPRHDDLPDDVKELAHPLFVWHISDANFDDAYPHLLSAILRGQSWPPEAPPLEAEEREKERLEAEQRQRVEQEHLQAERRERERLEAERNAPDSLPSLPLLRERAKDQDSGVRTSAVEALV